MSTLPGGRLDRTERKWREASWPTSGGTRRVRAYDERFSFAGYVRRVKRGSDPIAGRPVPRKGRR